MQEQIRVVVASGASTSSSAQFSRAYPRYGLDIGTMSTGSVVNVWVSNDNNSTFHKLFTNPNPLTSTVTHAAVQVGTSVGVGGGFVTIEGGFNGIQLRTAEVVSGGVSFNVIGLDG